MQALQIDYTHAATFKFLAREGRLWDGAYKVAGFFPPNTYTTFINGMESEPMMISDIEEFRAELTQEEAIALEMNSNIPLGLVMTETTDILALRSDLTKYKGIEVFGIDMKGEVIEISPRDLGGLRIPKCSDRSGNCSCCDSAKWAIEAGMFSTTRLTDLYVSKEPLFAARERVSSEMRKFHEELQSLIDNPPKYIIGERVHTSSWDGTIIDIVKHGERGLHSDYKVAVVTTNGIEFKMFEWEELNKGWSDASVNSFKA